MIRRMEEKDLEAVISLERELFSDPWKEKDYLPYLNDGRSVLLVAGRIEAYIAISAAADEGDILRVGVAGNSQRRGLGKRILDEALKQAEERGICRIFLEVRKSNVPARRLYESCGFEQTGIRKNYYREPAEDAVMMRHIAEND